MCDNILATPAVTTDRVMLFGKNSDRQRNEAQTVEHFPRAEHARDVRLKCTYLEISQARRTHAVLLCRPFWVWGAEMGANEYGVVIGNEGLKARGPIPEKDALTGMDLVRLALERATTALEAIEAITTLLERFGQGGNCGHLTPSYYHNSFMIADRSEAFVLETVGREWLYQRVTGVRAISNDYSIAGETERTSAGFDQLLREFRGAGDEPAAAYADVLKDPQRAHIGSARERRTRATALLDAKSGTVRVPDMIGILREHSSAGQPDSEAASKGTPKSSLCLHAGVDEWSGQTTGSMVSELGENEAVHWVTGTAAPCISIFKPVLMGVPLPPHGPLPTDRFDPRALWWKHERMHRAAVLSDLQHFVHRVRAERDALEAAFRRRVTSVMNGGDRVDRSKVIDECWREAIEMEDAWLPRIDALAVQRTPYLTTWIRMNELAGIEPR